MRTQERKNIKTREHESTKARKHNRFRGFLFQCLNRKEGSTLLEFLLYIGLVGIILTIAGGISLNVLLGKARLMAAEEVSQNTRFIIEKITERIRNAEAINSPAQGASASTLSLQVMDPLKNPTVFDLSSGVIRIKEGLGPTIALSSSEVKAADLQFSNVSYANTPGTVRVSMIIEFNNPGNRREYNFSKTFYTTANIRKK